MKTNHFLVTIVVFITFATSTFLYSQNNITNTLGTNGVFSIKDANAEYLTINQSTGEVNILNGLRLQETGNSSITGVIFRGASRFIHDFRPTGAPGYNTFIGSNSGNFTMSYSASNDASNNTGVGYSTLSGLTTGWGNTAFGSSSLANNTTGNHNTALGGNSLFSNTTGITNTALGFNSLYSNTTGDYNTALGTKSLYSNTTGNSNTAIGLSSLYFNTIGHSNTALGYGSLIGNTTGYENTGLGCNALSSNTFGAHNTAAGFNSLYSNITGGSNTGFGYSAMYSNTTGYYNTALGKNSLYFNTTGIENTATGLSSLYSNTTGNSNTALGYRTLYDNTTGFQNTAVGHHSLENNNGNYNTALGYNAGSTVTTGANLTLLGIDANPSSPTALNQITLGNAFVSSLRCNVQNISSLSDARDKKNIKELNLGIDFIMKLQPRLFNWDKREWYDDNTSDGSKIKEEPTAGFIAQELDEVQTTENAEWLNLVLKDNPEKLEATPGNLLPIIVKAIQDLKKENDELK